MHGHQSAGVMSYIDWLIGSGVIFLIKKAIHNNPQMMLTHNNMHDIVIICKKIIILQ